MPLNLAKSILSSNKKPYSIILIRVWIIRKIFYLQITIKQKLRTTAYMSRVMYENWWIDVTQRVWGEVDQNAELLLLLFCIINKQTNKQDWSPKQRLTHPILFYTTTEHAHEKSRTILHWFNIIGRFAINNEEIPSVVCKLGMVQCPPCPPPPPHPKELRRNRVHTYKSATVFPMLLWGLLASHQ